jgi:2-C-methyl-D-erythritol 4-phosphate cytidylyltransferase
MKIWAVVPAAGVGSRMNSAVPKQYLQLQGKSVLALTLLRLLELPLISNIVVAISAEELQSEDSYWQQLQFNNNSRIQVCAGADSRHGSVANALTALVDKAHEDDWILVHDAVRPCVRSSDIQALINAVQHHPAGGLLAAPVRDTLKIAEPGRDSVQGTLDRRHVWAAFTPQMFRYGLLRKALQHAVSTGIEITDESSAIEALNYSPLLIRGNPDNIKITHPGDLLLASAILTAQTSERNADV